MGWLDCHLWEFTIAKRRYGLPMDEDWGTQPRVDASKVQLRDVLRPGKTTIDYIYDFGDCWEHLLTVTNVRLGDPNLDTPATSPANATGRRKIAAAYPASMRGSTRRPIPSIPTTPRPSNGSTQTMTQTRSTYCRSNTLSVVSPIDETPRKPASQKGKQTRPLIGRDAPPSRPRREGRLAAAMREKATLFPVTCVTWSITEGHVNGMRTMPGLHKRLPSDHTAANLARAPAELRAPGGRAG